MIKKNITGIVLAGGKSSRMGTDKGILDLNGKKVIDYVIGALQPNVDDIIIVANNSNYNNLGYRVYKDVIQDCGPMGGIYTGLLNSSTEKNIILSCDIPFVTSPLLNYIISQSGDYDITVPEHDGKPEPLCAIYKKHCAAKFLDLLNKKEWKLKDAMEHFSTQRLQLTDKEIETNFININTPQELNKYTQK